ncbi:MAG: anthranilate synthase component I family protein, partial [Candidatus Omnitrophica bacterium]|nr:anthranilate synthase component I family protein [Candidatus Omnitrophota bacterium]
MIKAYPLTISSIRVFEIFRDEPQVFFLDSSQKNADRGRYSFIGFAPFDIYRAKDIHSLEALQKKFNRYKNTISKTTKTPLPAGIVGFISYDYGVRQENILRRSSVRNNETPDVYFGFYDTVITVDHYEKRLVISSTGLPAKDIKRQKERARKKIAYIEQKLKAGVSRHSPYEYAGVFQNRFKSSFSKNAYLSAVNKALVYIAKGDIYQVNLSQQFEYDVAGFPVDKVKVYKKLRDLSPSSFSAYLDAGAQTVMSSSPERFLKLEGRKVQTRPMKGTRPRGINKKQDARYLKEIKESPKEKAELLMITDLLRNDLGRVCEYGTVSVKTMRTIEKYKTVYQATSTVEGMLRKDHDAFDLLEACLPGGSITGCPKIRSMQIIEEVEPVRRGIYTGVMGY